MKNLTIVAALCLTFTATSYGQQPVNLSMIVTDNDNKGVLTTIAEESGGRVFFPETKEDLVKSAAEIILDLRAQFRIKYQSTDGASRNGFRKVDVKFVSTGPDKRKLIVPRGYYFGPRPPATTPEKKKS